MWRALTCVVLSLCAGLAMAQEDSDLDALQLADHAATKPDAPSNWRSFVEGSLGGSVLRTGDRFDDAQRASFDLRYDNSFSAGWRAVLSDRLDVDNPAQSPFSQTINTLRESYLSWQAQSDLLFDAGRINERNGVAFGYNPTDWFKTYAVRSAVSVDPNSLKENRQGSVMLRAQQLFDNGSVTLLYAPALDDSMQFAPFNPDFGATNHDNRGLISYSPKLSENVNPKLLLYKSDQAPLQVGLNLTSLVSDATVIYIEWAGGRSLSQLAQAESLQHLPYLDDTTFRSRSSTGLTYTTENKISFTLEYEYNGQGMQADQWNSIGHSPLVPLYGTFRAWLNAMQESPTRHAAFAYASWQDAMINRFDLSALFKRNLDDASRLQWFEARYHVAHAEFALQWQLDSGKPFSEFGAVPQVQTWALLGRYYF